MRKQSASGVLDIRESWGVSRRGQSVWLVAYSWEWRRPRSISGQTLFSADERRTTFHERRTMRTPFLRILRVIAIPTRHMSWSSRIAQQSSCSAVRQPARPRFFSREKAVSETPPRSRRTAFRLVFIAQPRLER